MGDYRRNDKADLSGMTPDQLRDHLEPKYDGDVDAAQGLKILAWFILGFGGLVTAILLLGWILFF